MKNKHQESLQSSAVLALEMLAFLMLEPLKEPENKTVKDYGVRIHFSGCGKTGDVEMWASNDLLLYIASNILNTDLPEKELLHFGQESLKEVTNIVVGNFLTEEYGTGEVFELGIPFEVTERKHLKEVIYLNSIEINSVLELEIGVVDG